MANLKRLGNTTLVNNLQRKIKSTDALKIFFSLLLHLDHFAASELRDAEMSFQGDWQKFSFVRLMQIFWCLPGLEMALTEGRKIDYKVPVLSLKL